MCWRGCMLARVGGAGESLPLHVGLAGGLDHVEGDHRVVVHDYRVVALDEAHATHVRGEVEDVVAAVAHLLAVVKHAQVDEDELVAEHLLLQGTADLVAMQHASSGWRFGLAPCVRVCGHTGVW